jgi:hypothetical protein
MYITSFSVAIIYFFHDSKMKHFNFIVTNKFPLKRDFKKIAACIAFRNVVVLLLNTMYIKSTSRQFS